ncbi:hypothetical protein BHM03_00033863, partial [Ensete ventricosum]
NRPLASIEGEKGKKKKKKKRKRRKKKKRRRRIPRAVLTRTVSWLADRLRAIFLPHREKDQGDVVNDLLNPAGQNLRIREDSQGTFVEGVKEEVVLSPAHALSLIAAGEGELYS